MSFEKQIRIINNEYPDPKSRAAAFAHAAETRAREIYEGSTRNSISKIQKAVSDADHRVQEAAARDAKQAGAARPTPRMTIEAARRWAGVSDPPTPSLADSASQAAAFSAAAVAGDHWRRARSAGLSGGELGDDEVWKGLMRRAASEPAASKALSKSAGVALGLALCAGDLPAALLARACGGDPAVAAFEIIRYLPTSGTRVAPQLDRALARLLRMAPRCAPEAGVFAARNGWVEGMEIVRRSGARPKTLSRMAASVREWANRIESSGFHVGFRSLRFPEGEASPREVADKWAANAELDLMASVAAPSAKARRSPKPGL